MKLQTFDKVTPPKRAGATLATLIFIVFVLLAIIALVFDVLSISLAKTELKRNADAAVLAAAGELYPSATPQFPLRSPLALKINVPDLIAVNLDHSFNTSVKLVDQQISIIDSSDRQRFGHCFKVAQEYSRLNSISGLLDFEIKPADLRIYHRPYSEPQLPLLPLHRLGIVSTVEDLLFAKPPIYPNSVDLTTRRSDSVNGSVALIWGSIFGRSRFQLSETSHATFYRGYGVTPGAPVLPIGMDITIWRVLRTGNGVVNGIPIAQSLLAGNGQPVILIDEQTWNPSTNSIKKGSDGIWEVILLNQPLDEVGLVDALNSSALLVDLPANIQGKLGINLLNGSPAQNALKTPSTIISLNFGGNGTEVAKTKMRHQIRNGLSERDIGRQLDLPFQLFGHHAVDASVLDELKSIVGQPRVIPLFETITGTAVNKVRGLTGAKEKYRIVGFGGVVVTEVLDLGVVRAIKLQPATISHPSILPAGPNAKPAFSDCVFTSPVLCD
jgi:hypothetical protein